MKIAVIGGGFYGCYISHYLSKMGHKVTIYEKNSELLNEAISNNQHRLHLGFHYPRCDVTIEQAKQTHKKFINTFPNCVETISNNLYAIHKDSMVDFQSYLYKMDFHGLEYEILDKSAYKNLFKNIDDIEGIIRTKEKKINLSKLVAEIKKNIITNENINVITNYVFRNEKKNKEYDYLINCSYTNPSIFLENTKNNYKYELCFMPLLEVEKKYEDNSITIMDGNFCSFYQADEKNTFTLSNVLYTPYFKSFDSESLYKIQKSLSKKQIKIICEKIIEDSKKYITIPDYIIKKCYISQKCKVLNDENDYRGSYCIKEENTITIVPGKISAVFDLLEKVEKMLDE